MNPKTQIKTIDNLDDSHTVIVNYLGGSKQNTSYESATNILITAVELPLIFANWISLIKM